MEDGFMHILDGRQINPKFWAEKATPIKWSHCQSDLVKSLLFLLTAIAMQASIKRQKKFPWWALVKVTYWSSTSEKDEAWLLAIKRGICRSSNQKNWAHRKSYKWRSFIVTSSAILFFICNRESKTWKQESDVHNLEVRKKIKLTDAFKKEKKFKFICLWVNAVPQKRRCKM